MQRSPSILTSLVHTPLSFREFEEEVEEDSQTFSEGDSIDFEYHMQEEDGQGNAWERMGNIPQGGNYKDVVNNNNVTYVLNSSRSRPNSKGVLVGEPKEHELTEDCMSDGTKVVLVGKSGADSDLGNGRRGGGSRSDSTRTHVSESSAVSRSISQNNVVRDTEEVAEMVGFRVVGHAGKIRRAVTGEGVNVEEIKIIPQSMAEFLVVQFSSKEIKEAVWGCGGDKVISVNLSIPGVWKYNAIVDKDLRKHEIELNKIMINNLEHLRIPFSDIHLATDNFSKTYETGSSKYFIIYRTELDHFDIHGPSIQGENNGKHAKRRNIVAIRRIKHRLNEVVFYNTIITLTSVKHRNIIALLGFCVDGLEMILVTENVNDHLDDYLGSVNRMRIMTWEKRLKICIDVAHSLNYIHFMMEDKKMIIQSCINRYNILLDENLAAKIVEFGLSAFMHGSYNVEEYKKFSKFQRELDVYNFGVVLFEILCGNKADDPIYLEKGDKGLAHVAIQLFYRETLEKMIDPIIMENDTENNLVLNSGANRDSLNTFIKIAYNCVTETKDQRPTMAVVVKELEEALSFQINNTPEPLFQRIIRNMIGKVGACLISCCEGTIQEKRLQCSNTDQVVDNPVINALEVQLRHEMPVLDFEDIDYRVCVRW
ncbi:hypothetical protein QVD17_20002 [Tagetes erecta]|uniref:Protein kinase domain-containing protein n=1 Tax=Tagetes erecta TaxID=13708 RepID=A0AAD8NWZ5_TARER|nr:hypothetical protein QVD17_20002 [Tagetes erecta]